MVDIWGQQLSARQSSTSLVHLGGFLFSRCSDGLSLNNATSQKPFLLRLLHLLFLNFLRASQFIPYLCTDTANLLHRIDSLIFGIHRIVVASLFSFSVRLHQKSETKRGNHKLILLLTQDPLFLDFWVKCMVYSYAFSSVLVVFFRLLTCFVRSSFSFTAGCGFF